MLRAEMRVILIGLVVVLAALGAWFAMGGPNAGEAREIEAVLASDAPVDEPAAYAHCASCHLHDGSGRPDGSIPKLNGQRRAVLENKLYRMKTGMTRLPVMGPYARSIAPKEITEIATYLSTLPDTAGAEHRDSEGQGAALYAQRCASCHGANAEGHDGLFASRLCGQYAGYLERRLDEILSHTRGDADAVMRGALDAVPSEELRQIVPWLAAGKGCTAP